MVDYNIWNALSEVLLILSPQQFGSLSLSKPEVTKWIAHHFSIKDQIVLSGDSAGGQLTLAVGLHLKQEGLSVKGLVPLYPMTQILSIHLKSMQTGNSWTSDMMCNDHWI